MAGCQLEGGGHLARRSVGPVLHGHLCGTARPGGGCGAQVARGHTAGSLFPCGTSPEDLRPGGLQPSPCPVLDFSQQGSNLKATEALLQASHAKAPILLPVFIPTLITLQDILRTQMEKSSKVEKRNISRNGQ